MANICEYKVIVKGRKNACYAFFGSMSCLDNKWAVAEDGTDEDYTLRFQGDCKWSVDSYCTPWSGPFPVVLPEDADKARVEAEEKYWYNTVRERSKMFEVEVLCNSADIDDYDPDEGPDQIFEHYINGKCIDDECPDCLQIGGWDDDCLRIGDCSEDGEEATFPMFKSIEGTAYEGRNARIEFVKAGDPLILKADYNNKFYFPVAIEVFNAKNETLGYLCDGYDGESLKQIAKHIDNIKARVASVTPLSKRSKRAKYALVDVELYFDNDPPLKETKPSSETHKKKEEKATKEAAVKKEEEKARLAEGEKARKEAEEKALIAKIESAEKKIRAFKEGETTLRNAVSSIRAEHRKAEQRYDRAEREVERMASNSIDVFSYDLESRIRDVIKTATNAAEELCDDCDKLIKKMDKQCSPYLDCGMDPHLIKAVADEMRELFETADINVNFSGSFEGTSFGNVGNVHYEASAAAGKIVKKWRTESKKIIKALSVDGLLKECGVSEEEYQQHLSYKDAIAAFSTAKTSVDITKVQKSMKSLNRYLDSEEYLKKCEEMLPKLVEKEKKQDAEKAAKEAKRKAEEEEKARKAAEEKRIYEEKYAIWCTEKKTIEARRAEILRKKIDVFRALLEREVENWYTAEKQRIEEKETTARTEQMEAESKLETLGFFKLKEKSNCKQIIWQASQVLESIPNEKRKMTSQYKSKKSEVEEKVKNQETLLKIKIAKDEPIPTEPKKPAAYKPAQTSASTRSKKSTNAPERIFTGYTFVVADMPSAKEDARIRKEIKLRGGMPVTTVTQKLDYLVCSRVKRGITTRIDAALDNQKKGFPVKIITIKEFEEMISEENSTTKDQKSNLSLEAKSLYEAMEDDVSYTATQISLLGIAGISSASKATTVVKELVGEGKVINQKVRGVSVYRKV